MNISKCRLCGKKINSYYRTDTRFCSDLCRKRHYDLLKRPNANKTAKKELQAVVEDNKQKSFEFGEGVLND